ncbi:hypothetical protein DL771_004923 [Monosporascus sp. 5C6A]|nr:hypothetical protein DL771_004923 [Monosporascus sp. 5C6A]
MDTTGETFARLPTACVTYLVAPTGTQVDSFTSWSCGDAPATTTILHRTKGGPSTSNTGAQSTIGGSSGSGNRGSDSDGEANPGQSVSSTGSANANGPSSLVANAGAPSSSVANAGTIAGIVLGIIIVLSMVGWVVWKYRKRRKGTEETERRHAGFTKEFEMRDPGGNSEALMGSTQTAHWVWTQGHVTPILRQDAIAILSEFAGTFMFLLFAFGGTNTVNSAPLEGRPENLAANPPKLVFICLCFGMSLAVNAWTFFRISGGLFNPAVGIGMMVVGARNENHLVFTIFMLAAEKHRGTFIAPIGIGLSLFIAELMGVYYTSGSLNPARSFGPCIVTGQSDGYHWIYWVGPILGALVASGFYVLIKTLEYETVNPEQDYDTLSRKTPLVKDRGGPDINRDSRPHDAPMNEPYSGGPELEAGRRSA